MNGDQDIVKKALEEIRNSESGRTKKETHERIAEMIAAAESLDQGW